MATYKVQKGDTLSKIAAQSGVKLSDISGYRSGDPNKIFEGETLTIGSAPKSEADTYASTVKDELGSTESKGSSIYDSTKLKADKDTYKTKLDDAFKTYQSVQQDTFDEEYESRDLGKKKERLSQIDSDIAEKRRIRDEAINKVRTNPGLSAAQMTGDIKKAADYSNAEINNLIQERNGIAGEYNAALDEIDSAVARKAGSAKAEYDYYAGLLGNTETALGNYQSSLIDELKSDTQADQFDRQLAQALEIAQMKGTGGGSSNRSLVRDPRTGDPLYWFDPDTSEITYVDSGGNDGGEDDIFNTDEAPAASSSAQPWYSRLWGAITGK